MLVSERLLYSQLSLEDEHISIEMAKNAQVMVYITGKALSPEEAKERFKNQLATNTKYPDLGFIKGVSKETGGFIGYVKMTPLEPGNLEIGYGISPEHWGKGYATEMLFAMIDTASRLKEFKQIVGIADPVNIPSIRILEKSGFQFDREEEQNCSKRVYYIKNNL